MEYIVYEKRDLTGILTINRPKALNALNSSVVAEFSEFLDQLAKSEIRCLIVTGAGEKAFVAGADVAEMQGLSQSEAADFSDRGNEVMEKLEGLPVPVIAAVNGFALGGGCEIALSCDIRIASENASFSFPEAGLGIIPGYGGLQRMSRLVGIGKAKELAYTANRIKAAEALAIGLVNRVVPAESLMDSCLELAASIAANAPFSVKAIKKIINESIGLPLLETYRLERRLFADCFNTQDQKMAMAAFTEKRKPDPFTGR
ncbi:enoyl-CoA hydratase/isomerase family protein [Desulfovibrio sp. OttesenSCG-928-C06]|nr:enoyl-CoA hydratase/isomerase family protein [Desulfovibrio sp. OttesenSCG-928-C06]